MMPAMPATGYVPQHCGQGSQAGCKLQKGHRQPTLRQQQDVVKEVVALRAWLEQRHEQGCLPNVHKVAHAFHNLEGAAAVQAGGDLQAGREASQGHQ